MTAATTPTQSQAAEAVNHAPATGPEATPAVSAAEAEAIETARADSHALETGFVILLLLLSVAAFLEALTYELVSSRIAFVALVPLIALLTAQLVRLLRADSLASVRARASEALAGRVPSFRKMIGMVWWLVALLLTIAVAGHYIAIAGFLTVLMRGLAREPWRITLIVTVATTALIYAAFEWGFDIELYRGLVYRYFAGYRVF